MKNFQMKIILWIYIIGLIIICSMSIAFSKILLEIEEAGKYVEDVRNISLITLIIYSIFTIIIAIIEV